MCSRSCWRVLKKMFFGCVVCEQVCFRADLLLCCLSLSLASIVLARSRDASSSLKSDKNIDKSDLWSSWWILWHSARLNGPWHRVEHQDSLILDQRWTKLGLYSESVIPGGLSRICPKWRLQAGAWVRVTTPASVVVQISMWKPPRPTSLFMSSVHSYRIWLRFRASSSTRGSWGISEGVVELAWACISTPCGRSLGQEAEIKAQQKHRDPRLPLETHIDNPRPD